jgi:two-component system, cell cycle sensor histidine kinase and response regulator CckA
VRDTERLIRVSLGKSVRLDMSGLGAGLPPVRIDRGQLQQVVMNLTINASDAIGEREGTVSFKTSLADPLLLESELRDTPWLLFEISDDGPGILPQNLERIFDPFFTTKATGRGLGLAAVQGIVKAHHGKLSVSSVPGSGTVFRLFLPCSGAARVVAPESTQAQSEVFPTKRVGTILIVDDEEMIRRALQRQLESRGYVVITAVDGVEAVSLVRDTPNRFDAVLLDLTMPRLDGTRTFHQMREIRESIRVVLMSGYSEAHATGRFEGLGLVGFLKKPIEKDDLFRLLDRAIDPEHTANRAQKVVG